MNSTWTQRLLLFAAAWNIIGALASMADPAHHFAQTMTVAAPLDNAVLMYFYWCTWINVLAWGVAYGLAACMPGAHVAVLAAGSAGKAGYFMATAALVAADVGKPVMLIAGIGDLVMALLFAWALLSTSRVSRTTVWSAS